MMGMTSFDPSKHPRTTSGRFTESARAESVGVTLTPVPQAVLSFAGENVYDLGEVSQLTAADLVAAYNVLGEDADLRVDIRYALPGLDEGAVGELARQLAWAGAMQRWFAEAGVDAVSEADSWEYENGAVGRLLKEPPAYGEDWDQVAAANAAAWHEELHFVWARAAREQAGTKAGADSADLPHASGA